MIERRPRASEAQNCLWDMRKERAVCKTAGSLVEARLHLKRWMACLQMQMSLSVDAKQVIVAIVSGHITSMLLRSTSVHGFEIVYSVDPLAGRQSMMRTQHPPRSLRAGAGGRTAALHALESTGQKLLDSWAGWSSKTFSILLLGRVYVVIAACPQRTLAIQARCHRAVQGVSCRWVMIWYYHDGC